MSFGQRTLPQIKTPWEYPFANIQRFKISVEGVVCVIFNYIVIESSNVILENLTTRSPGQSRCEAADQVEEGPGDDDAVVDVQEEDDGHGGVSNTCYFCVEIK